MELEGGGEESRIGGAGQRGSKKGEQDARSWMGEVRAGADVGSR